MTGPFKLKSGKDLKDFFTSLGANLKRNRRDIGGENKGKKQKEIIQPVGRKVMRDGPVVGTNGAGDTGNWVNPHAVKSDFQKKVDAARLKKNKK